jgi:tetratricopeptide (TPR) repeat protein
MALKDPDDLKTQVEFDRHMTAARVYRNRGDYAKAGEEIQQALKLRPADLDAREFAADVIFAHGDIEKAAEHYKSILEVDPSRSSAEEKYAKAILQIAEAERQKKLLQEMIEQPGKTRTPPRSAVLAALVSIAPGFGQIYCTQYVKGMITFAAWSLSWLLCLAFVGPPDQRLSVPTLFFGCLATSIHLYALVDAVSQAERTRSGNRNLTEP